MRKPHKIKRAKSMACPGQFVFFDIESTQAPKPGGETEHTFKLGWAAIWKRPRKSRPEKLDYYPLRHPADLWALLEQHLEQGRTTILMAHNIVFDFTLTGGFTASERMGYKPDMFYFSQGTNIIRLVRNRQKILLLDSLNYFKMPLRELGDMMGLPKGSITFDDCTDKELSDYCYRDVEILVVALQQLVAFIKTNELGQFRWSIAGQAFQAFRHRFMSDSIYIHDNTEAIELEREAYTGGRTEAFFIGEKNSTSYYQVDINSMYPFVMRDKPYPVRLHGILRNINIECPLQAENKDTYIAECELDTDTPIYPYRHSSKLVFPVGRFTTTLSTPEVREAARRGHLVKLRRVAIYTSSRIFSKYVSEIYRLRIQARLENNYPYDRMLKLLLNSLYGKFGQKAEQWERLPDDADIPDGVTSYVIPSTGERGKTRKLGKYAWVMEGEEEARNSFPAVAAHVTAYARIYLWGLIETAGRDNVLYVDTDSLLLTPAGFQNIRGYIDTGELGKLKLEYTTDTINIRGAKDYIIGDKYKLKGISPSAKQLADNTFQQQVWPGFKSIPPGATPRTYTCHTVVKTLSRNYDKGEVLPSGDVRPLRF